MLGRIRMVWFDLLLVWPALFLRGLFLCQQCGVVRSEAVRCAARLLQSDIFRAVTRFVLFISRGTVSSRCQIGGDSEMSLQISIFTRLDNLESQVSSQTIFWPGSYSDKSLHMRREHFWGWHALRLFVRLRTIFNSNQAQRENNQEADD